MAQDQLNFRRQSRARAEILSPTLAWRQTLAHIPAPKVSLFNRAFYSVIANCATHQFIANDKAWRALNS